MLEAITYQEMLRDINNNQIREDTIGILITRPELEVGEDILKSLNHYHHLSGKSKNFYLPGYGAYWYGSYPDGRVVTKIDGIDWSFSDRVFINFINELEQYSTWKYSGESELLMIEYKDGIVSFENMMRFYLDNMLRDRAIVSVPAFFQQLFRILSDKRSNSEISNMLGMNKAFQITKQAVLDNISPILSEIFTQEKYFCVRNYNK